MFERLSKISELFYKNASIDTSGMTIVFELEESDLLFFDKELYVKKNGSLKNFVKNEEIEVLVNGIKFLVKKKI